MISFGTVQPHEVEAAWSWVNPFLSDLEKTNPGWDSTDVFLALVRREAQCWFIAEHGKPVGIVITKLGKVNDTPSGLLWNALQAGIGLLTDHIEPWFREMGCKFVEINGRKGWSKVLDGYRETTRVFVKEL